MDNNNRSCKSSLSDDATITQTETAAAVEAAKAGQIIFDVDGNMSEEWEKTQRTKIRMKEDTEERQKRRRDDNIFLVLMTFRAASKSANEMTNSKFFTLGAKPKWTAQPPSIRPCPNCGDPSLPPWREKSLWRITTTKTTGQLSEKQFRGSKKKTDELCEMMKHAKEYAEVLQEYEEGKQREFGIETSEIVEEKDQEWTLKIDEIHTLMREMTRGQK